MRVAPAQLGEVCDELEAGFLEGGVVFESGLLLLMEGDLLLTVLLLSL